MYVLILPNKHQSSINQSTGAALDFVRSQYGRYFEVKPNLSPVELGGSVCGLLDWGSKPDKGLLVRDSLPGESLCCVLSKARHFISCCLSTGSTYEDRKSFQHD